MPFFFIAPLWFVFVVAGIGFCFFRRTRFLSTYIIICSTSGLIFSFISSLAALLPMALLLGHAGSSSDASRLAGLALAGLGYVAGLAIGGLIGVAAGFFVARWVNRRLRWTLDA